MKEYIKMIKYLKSEITSKETIKQARNSEKDFIRKSKLGYESLIKMILCRTGKTVSNEILNYYSEIDNLEKSVSKQSVFQAREKLNPTVFRHLNNKLIQYYYLNNKKIKTYKNYNILSIDGTVLEMPLTEGTKEIFGITQSTKFPTKTSPRCSGIYDVLNNIYLDFIINNWKVSEIPMAYKQIKTIKEIFKEKKCIFLADRYYGATDLFLYFEKLDFKYCIRGKKNFYKHYLNSKEKDSIVNIPLDETWINRLKIKEVKDMAKEKGLTIRVIRFNKSQITTTSKDEEIILFTNLSKEEFTSEEIIKLYGKRWCIETGYGVLKTKMEIERVTSEKVNIILQDLYSQIIVYNLMSMIKNIINKKIDGTTKYKYQANINNLVYLFRKWLPHLLNKTKNLISIISKIINQVIKNKEPIRENRSYPRWNAYIIKPVTLKFRVDGKRNPKVHKTKKGYLRIAR